MGDIKELSSMASELSSLRVHAERLETELESVRKRAEDLEERRIPEMMDDLGVTEFKTTEGFTIKIEPQVFAHISREHQEPAYRWLEENGHGGMIKRRVIVAFGKDQEAAAGDLVGQLAAKYPVKQEREVHPATLKSWAKKRLEDGDDVPMDLFGIFVKRVAKIGE